MLHEKGKLYSSCFVTTKYPRFSISIWKKIKARQNQNLKQKDFTVQSAAELKVQKSEFRKNRKILQIFYLS